MCNDFVHLHNHSEYSLLDGLPNPEALVQRAVELGQPGIAITDHGTIAGVVEFARKAKDHNIIPIIGYEGYTTRFGNSMYDKDSGNRENFHALLIAENETGYKNLIKLSSIASTEGFYGKPRFDFETLEKHKSGIITTTGCMASPILRAIGQNYSSSYIETLFEWYIDVFGKDNFFVELQDHVGIPELPNINKTLLDYAKKYKLRVVVTNDAHYARPDDAQSHDLLLCVQTHAFVNQQQRMRFSDNEYYIKSRDQMEKITNAYGLGADALDITVEIMERCKDLSLESKQRHHMPSIAINSAYKDYDDALADMSDIGMNILFGMDWKKNYPAYEARLNEELEIIRRTGFAVYYLIIKDICDYARDNSILWNVRGSGTGSLVSFACGMSFIDPVKHKLVFSRFLNDFRVSIPDFDMDFPDNAREEIIQYLVDKYGQDQVAQIVTFGRMKARLCVRDVTRALGWQQTEIDALANKINNTPGKPITIENSLDPSSEYYSALLKEEYDKNPEAKKALDVGRRLEKTIRHTGVHAAAVIISDAPLTEYTPIAKSPQIATTKYTAQYEYPILESLGMLKVDILGLATLSIIRETCKLIKERHNVDIDYFNIPFDEGDTTRAFELLCSGEVKGVFQVESFGIRNVLMELRPVDFQQVMDVISLYRPGPLAYIPTYIKRAHGKEKPEYLHPDLEEILKSSQAIMIYQEQIIRILQKIGGYSAGEADVIRKAISKKDVKKIEEEKKRFISQAQTNGYTEHDAHKIFDDIEKFALYGFNLAHAASYARMTMVTAWLKANYPIEFITSCLVTEWSKPEKVSGYILEARRMGVPVLPPDINKSKAGFTIEENSDTIIDSYSKFDYNIKPGSAIRFGFESIKQVGIKGAESLTRASGHIKELNDILKIDFSDINTRSLRRLTGAGVFDSIASRISLIGNEENIIENSKRAQFVYLAGQYSFAKPELTLQPTSEAIDLYAEEKESLGVWITSHPIEEYYNRYFGAFTHTIYDVINDDTADDVTLIVVVDKVKDFTSRNGKPMAFVTFSDIYGTIEAILFSQGFSSFRELLKEDNIVIVRAKVSRYKEEPGLIINGVYSQILVEKEKEHEADELIQQVKIYAADREEVKSWVSNASIFNDGATLIVKVFTLKGEPNGVIRRNNSALSLNMLKNSDFRYLLE